MRQWRIGVVGVVGFVGATRAPPGGVTGLIRLEIGRQTAQTAVHVRNAAAGRSPDGTALARFTHQCVQTL